MDQETDVYDLCRPIAWVSAKIPCKMRWSYSSAGIYKRITTYFALSNPGRLSVPWISIEFLSLLFSWKRGNFAISFPYHSKLLAIWSCIFFISTGSIWMFPAWKPYSPNAGIALNSSIPANHQVMFYFLFIFLFYSSFFTLSNTSIALGLYKVSDSFLGARAVYKTMKSFDPIAKNGWQILV